MNSDFCLDNILKNLLILKEEINARNKLGYTDLNKSVENFFCKVLNIIYGYDLKNLNEKQENYPGIDLGDLKNSIAYQITSEKTSKKINQTLQEYIDNKYYEDYSQLKIFIVGSKQNSYSINIDTALYFKFDIKSHIIDLNDLFKIINNLEPKKN